MKKLKQKKNKQNRQTKITTLVKPKLLTLAITQALAFQTVQAATIEVTSLLDDNGEGCTLREAISSVNNATAQQGCEPSGSFGNNDTLTFAANVSGGTISLTNGRISIVNSISINPGGIDTTISGNDNSRIFQIFSFGPSITVDLDHLILTQGNGAISISDAIGSGASNTLNISNSSISGNTASGDGGGIIAIRSSTVSLTDSIVSGNSARFGGGLFADDSSTVNLVNSTVFDNAGTGGGGGLFATNSSTISLTDSTLSGNTGTEAGGIFADMATVNLANSTVSGNSSYHDGGGLRVSSSTISLTDSTVSGNSAISGGGLFADDSSTVNLANSTVSGNSAYGGGGLFARLSSVSLVNSTVSGNMADFSGGFSVGFTSTANLTNCTVSDNSAGASAGGISVDGGSSLGLINSTISGNSAAYNGGGIRASSGGGLGVSTVSLTNSTVSENSAQIGGGISAGVIPNLFSPSTVSLTNSTVSGNTASGNSMFSISGGGIFNSNGSTLSISNSIIADSVADNDCQGSNVIAGPDNIIEADSCGTSAISIHPGLISLADNGGPTETHALMPGSPAIDAGNDTVCEATDQRGEARDDGNCDIGAYEFKATVMPIAKKDRKMGNLLSGGEQWYSFNSTESQKLSLQTNGFSGDTILDLYEGDNFASVVNISMDDDSGPQRFSNIKQEVISGPHLIRVKSKTNVNPYWLRLMSDRDILSFSDTASHFANKEIRVMSSAGITGGCGTNKYCPTDPVTRAQMAIFMLKAILGGNHSSPAATGSVFSDVGTSSFGASFIEEFSTLGITSGCGGGKYCPDLAVTREQMAVFLLRAWYGSSYTPPAATPAEINQFSDIANSFAKDWIVQLTKENITGGCGGGKFCPTDTVTRGQMSAFIARTFSLDTEL